MNKLGARSLPDLVRMAEILRVDPFARNKIAERMADAEISRQRHIAGVKPDLEPGSDVSI
jgi:hypothetical protein